MNLKLILPSIVVGLLIGIGLSSFSGHDHQDSTTVDESPEINSNTKEILYWYDPMSPGAHFDKPGKSPFMDMDLVPRYADNDNQGGITINPTQVQNLGLRTTKIRRGKLTFSRELPANIEFNNYQQARIQPRADGFVSSIQNLAIGDPIEAEQELAEITVPAWASDQSEYLLLKSQRADGRIINGVREKMRLNGMPEEMLKKVDDTGKVQTNLKITSPISGIVTALDVYPGMNVDKNMTLAVIQGIDPIWITAEIPESELYLAKEGKARITTPAWPEVVFEAESFNLLPQANPETRTVSLRLSVSNQKGLLKPGLTASIRLKNQGQEAILIPTQALIDLGNEKRVITRAEDGSFIPKLVTVINSAREQTAISSGLNEDDEVVVSGIFLIDSEANLRGALDRMRNMDDTQSLTTSQDTDNNVEAHSHDS